jgi:hypothetical protein
MLALAVAAVLASTPAQDQDPAPSPTPPAASAPADVAQDEPVALEDVEVTGASLDSLIRSFVSEVAAPNKFRGLARWDGKVCVGVANLRQEAAQFIVDRVSTVAEDLGLEAGAPGCRPNVIIIATDRPDELAARLVQDNRNEFRPGGAGMDRGVAALRNFVASDQPVRWWQVSVPVDSNTGTRAVRMPGDCINACLSPADSAPVISVFAASRLSSQIVDHLFRTIIIVSADQVSHVSGQQLADYIAMVAMAQIDPQADTSRYASILNVFDAPETASSLTDWDISYLTGLYDAERRRRFRAGRSEVIGEIHRAHRRLREQSDE